jgi:CRP/FNR family transcriptional regulator, cyclic AMP receptor protein
MPTDATSADLDRCSFFHGLAPEYLDFLARHAARRIVADGDMLFRHGDSARSFFLVLSGHVSVEIPAIEGPVLQLQDLGPGDVVGWSWLIAPHKWNFQARVTLAAEVLEFDGAAVLEHCEQDPRFGYELLKRFSALMSERLRLARDRMMQEWKPAGFA